MEDTKPGRVEEQATCQILVTSGCISSHMGSSLN